MMRKYFFRISALLVICASISSSEQWILCSIKLPASSAFPSDFVEAKVAEDGDVMVVKFTSDAEPKVEVNISIDMKTKNNDGIMRASCGIAEKQALYTGTGKIIRDDKGDPREITCLLYSEGSDTHGTGITIRRFRERPIVDTQPLSK